MRAAVITVCGEQVGFCLPRVGASKTAKVCFTGLDIRKSAIQLLKRGGRHGQPYFFVFFQAAEKSFFLKERGQKKPDSAGAADLGRRKI
jgi:hypothetical protein